MLPAPPDDYSYITCFRCGGKGHYATSCQVNLQDKSKPRAPETRMVEIQKEDYHTERLEVDTYAVTRAKRRRATTEEGSTEKQDDSIPKSNWDKEKRTVQQIAKEIQRL